MKFIKLIRPINLLIIAITMYGVRFYTLEIHYFEKVKDDSFDFFLLVFSTVIIAAAGNIINDYFDVRADRINKPEKLIITKHIKRRWAILIHWIFNGIAFGIALYLSIKYQSLWFVFIHLLSINALWFYSMFFKRKILIGNIMVAALTALVPILTVIYFKVGNTYHLEFSEFKSDSWIAIINYDFFYVLAFFAFVQNLAREIIKDMQDVEGDKLIYATSLPMILGEKKSLWIVNLLLSILPIFYLFFSLVYAKGTFEGVQYYIATIPFLLTVIINLLVIYISLKDSVKRLKLYNALIKISMLIGILSTFYIALLATQSQL
jgi:4-hydroxybenzoate polyprenyltransferase